MFPPSPEANPASEASGVHVRLEERFTLHARLGEGSSGTVWEATEHATGRTVALKRLRAGAVGDRGRVAERFVAEARALARLEHPHLIRIEAVLTEHTGTPCLVMERLRGQTLAQRLEVQPTLSVQEAFRLLVPLMGALATAHDAGVIHRDVKPANLFLRRDEHESSPWPVLLDFGAAKLDDGEGKATTSGMTVGTPCYMAPEQAQGLELGPYTDVWAMGVVWYRCLTGALPFDAETSLGVVIKLSRERAPRLADVLPEMPMPLAVALDRALEPAPTARYPDMRAFARALASAAAQAGLDVERAPDPQALPEFGRWLDEADAESTAALPALTAARPDGAGAGRLATTGAHASRAGSQTHAAVREQAATLRAPSATVERPTRWRGWVAALILAAAGAGALAWGLSRPTGTSVRAQAETSADGSNAPPPGPALPASTSAAAEGSADSREPRTTGGPPAASAEKAAVRPATGPGPEGGSAGPPAEAPDALRGVTDRPAAPLTPAARKPLRPHRPALERRARAERSADREASSGPPASAEAPSTPVATGPAKADTPTEAPPESPRVIEDFNW